MTTTWKLFAFSGGFGLLVATVYWFVTYETTGTVILASMGLAPLIVAAWAALHGRGPKPPPDRPDAGEDDERAEQPAGAFPLSTAWPAAFAAGSLLVATGLVFGVWLFLVGVAVSAIAVYGLMRESRA